jgi:soluble lytic murein transglycosylase-like protein
MSKRRSAVLIAAALGVWLALPPRALTGGPRATDPAYVRTAPPDTLAAFYAARYGIDAELAGTIHRLAVENGLEPAAVFGLIATESRFDARAVGRSGAIGLMQIKPSTARAYDPHVTRARLFNPEINLRFGLTHLRRELAHFGHDWTLGLLSYNMGRTRLSRALSRGIVPRNGYASKVLAHCGKLCT